MAVDMKKILKMITMYLGDDSYGYQGRHLLVGVSIGNLADEGFD